MGGRLDFIGSGVGGPENVVGALMKSRCGVVECARGRLTGTVDRIGGARPISATFSFTSAGGVRKSHACGCRHTGGSDWL
jgi:hypothetical protein